MKSSGFVYEKLEDIQKAVACVSLFTGEQCVSHLPWIIPEATGMEITQAEEELNKRFLGVKWRNTYIYDMGIGRGAHKGD